MPFCQTISTTRARSAVFISPRTVCSAEREVALPRKELMDTDEMNERRGFHLKVLKKSTRKKRKGKNSPNPQSLLGSLKTVTQRLWYLRHAQWLGLKDATTPPQGWPRAWEGPWPHSFAVPFMTGTAQHIRVSPSARGLKR